MTYTSEFFRVKNAGARRSAEAIVPIVLDAVEPSSVVDVGCGQGAWLAVFEEHGVTDLTGVDGDYIDRAELSIPPERFVAHDLERPLDLPRTYDLVVSLEVAEHLSARWARQFVESLTSLGPAVLFSAAVPGQGGHRHVNEQWPGYWAELFAAHGYGAVDCIRWRVWGNRSVDPWYAQNTILYVKGRLGERPVAVVHPAMYLVAARPVPSLRWLLAHLPSAARSAIKRRVAV